MSLTQRLIALVALAFVPAIVVLVLFEQSLRGVREQEMRDTAWRQTQQVNSEMMRLQEGMETLLVALSSAPVVRRFDAVLCPGYLREVRRALPHLLTLIVLDARGDLRCSDLLDGRTANYADRSYFKAVLATNDFVTGQYTVGRLFPDRAGLPFAYPVRGDDGSVDGVVVAVLGLDHLDAIVSSWSLPEGASLTIADTEGVIMARNPFPDRFVGTRIPDPFQPWVRAADGETTEVVSQDGTRRMLSYKPVSLPPVGLYVSSGISIDKSYAALADARWSSLLLIAIGVVATAALALAVASVSVRRPVRELVALADAWAAGAAPAKGRFSVPEFASVAAALDRMGHELNEIGERLRRTVRAAPVPLMLHAADGEIIEISETWFTRSGYAPESVSKASDWFAAALKGSGGATDPAVTEPGAGVERTITMPDGGLRTWEFATVALGRLPDGRALRLTAASDVTERQRAAVRQDLLVRELNHRVKNTLAMVQSIAAQTIKGNGDNDAMVARFTDRLTALARTHDLLTRGNWDPVALDELLLAEVQHLDAGGRVRLSGPALALPAEIAVSVSLLVHELATNAVKYGALSVPEGRVEVDWTDVGPSTGIPDVLVLRWTEMGGPRSTPPSRQGFGMRLIRQVSQSIGRGALDFGAEGLRFRLEIDALSTGLAADRQPASR